MYNYKERTYNTIDKKMCRGLTKKGLQCKRSTTGYCYLHKSQAPVIEQIPVPEPVVEIPIKDPYKELYNDLVIKSITENEDHKHTLDKLERELENYKKMSDSIFQEKLRLRKGLKG